MLHRWAMILGFLGSVGATNGAWAAPVAPPLPAATAEFRLIQPPESGTVLDREVHIVAFFPVKADARLTITVSLDGKVLKYRLLAGTQTYLHATTTATELGAHNVEITVEGSEGSASAGSRRLIIWKKNARFEISDPLSLRSPNGFTPKPFHDGSQTGCEGTKCHDFKLEKGKRVAAGTGCRMCHKREGTFRHAPVRQGECAICHTPENGAFVPTKTADETCFVCHDDKKKALKNAKFIHGPTAKLVCELCHDPHGSRETMMTWRGKNELCVTCHAGYDKAPHVVAGFATGSKGHPIATVANKLEQNTEFSCGACHNPHGAENGMLFAYGKTTRNDLCKSCHDDKF